MRRLGPLLLAAACLASAGCCELTRGVLFPAPRRVREPVIGELLEIDAPGGRTCAASYVRAIDDMPTIAHFHGNGQQLADLDAFAEALADRGFGFFAVEFPGYGVADGHPTEESIDGCADASLRFLQTRLGVPRARTVLQGQSIGTGVAVEMARRGLGARLVLLSAYTSLPELFESKGVPGTMTCDRFDSASKARTIAMPVLLIHGDDDPLIPSDMSRALADRFPHASLVIIDGAHHNDLFAGRRALALLDVIARFAQDP